MDENGISEQFRENVIDGAVVAGTFMGDKPVEGIAPGGEPGSKFPEFDIAPLGVAGSSTCQSRLPAASLSGSMLG